MQIIDFGYKLPELSDKDFWQSYNFDIERLSTHDHDGINSALLDAGHMNPTLLLVETADWNGPVDDVYTTDPIALPANVTWPDGSPCPVIVKGFTTANLSCNVNYSRVDDNNFQLTQKTDQELIVGIY